MTTEINRSIYVKILGGGNKFELFQQLQNIGLEDENGRMVNRPHFRITARLEGLGNLFSSDDHIWITGISAQDGSGESWNIEGRYQDTAPKSNFTTRRGGSFQGLYNTRTRNGFFFCTFNY